MKITQKQAEQFNIMLETLRRIAGTSKNTRYMTPDQLRRDAERNTGLDFEEEIEMAYENMQSDAKQTSSGIKPIKLIHGVHEPVTP